MWGCLCVGKTLISEELYNSFPEGETPKEKEKNKKIKFAGSLKTNMASPTHNTKGIVLGFCFIWAMHLNFFLFSPLYTKGNHVHSLNYVNKFVPTFVSLYQLEGKILFTIYIYSK